MSYSDLVGYTDSDLFMFTKRQGKFALLTYTTVVQSSVVNAYVLPECRQFCLCTKLIMFRIFVFHFLVSNFKLIVYVFTYIN